jgi:S1-C subfamily serine protease
LDRAVKTFDATVARLISRPPAFRLTFFLSGIIGIHRPSRLFKGGCYEWIPSIPRRISLAFLGGITLTGIGLATCSPPRDVAVHEPIAAASQPISRSHDETALISQSFVAVAKTGQGFGRQRIRDQKSLHRKDQGTIPFFDDPFFRRFFGEEFERRMPRSPENQEQGLGSGVIVSSDGYIVLTIT